MPFKHIIEEQITVIHSVRSQQGTPAAIIDDPFQKKGEDVPQLKWIYSTMPEQLESPGNYIENTTKNTTILWSLLAQLEMP
jgi:hypothetical protein